MSDQSIDEDQHDYELHIIDSVETQSIYNDVANNPSIQKRYCCCGVIIDHLKAKKIIDDFNSFDSIEECEKWFDGFVKKQNEQHRLPASPEAVDSLH